MSSIFLFASEMDILDALEELRELNARSAKVGENELLDQQENISAKLERAKEERRFLSLSFSFFHYLSLSQSDE